MKTEIACFVFKYWKDIKMKLNFTKANNKTKKLKGNRRKLDRQDIKLFYFLSSFLIVGVEILEIMKIKNFQWAV